MNQKQFLDTLSSMPPLHHTLPGEAFDADKSEVIAWMIARPGFKNWLFHRMTHSERIEYDAASGCWHGVQRGPVGRPRTGA